MVNRGGLQASNWGEASETCAYTWICFARRAVSVPQQVIISSAVTGNTQRYSLNQIKNVTTTPDYNYFLSVQIS